MYRVYPKNVTLLNMLWLCQLKKKITKTNTLLERPEHELSICPLLDKNSIFDVMRSNAVLYKFMSNLHYTGYLNTTCMDKPTQQL